MDTKLLIKTAIEAMGNSYSPYSGFKVGAALLAKNGDVFKGCNIENAAFSPTNCAERTAFFSAVSTGIKDFEAICVVGGKGGQLENFCPPCGVCLQVMMEFCEKDNFKIILAKDTENYEIHNLCEFLPFGFEKENV